MRTFDEIAAENRSWMVAYAKGKLKEPDAAEDVVQEALLKAGRAYERYTDEGKERAWLMRILQNALKDYYRGGSPAPLLSLDLATDEQDDLYHWLSDPSPTPEERVIQIDTVRSILRVAQVLPKKQKAIFTLRFLEGRTLEETADRLNLPVGSVKSGGNAAIHKIRNTLGIKLSPDLLRRNHSMENKSKEHEFSRDRLYLYAKGLLSHEKLAEAEGHLAICPSCRKVAGALKKLLSTVTFGADDEVSSIQIRFPDEKVIFTELRVPVPNWEEVNRVIAEGGWPFEKFIEIEADKELPVQLMADNSGSELSFVVTHREDDPDRCYATVDRAERVYPSVHLYMTVTSEDGSMENIERSNEAPDLYRSHVDYGFYHNGKCGLYQALPAGAENVRIRRGNGVCDCGEIKFAYTDRYYTEEESVELQYSYLLKDKAD